MYDGKGWKGQNNSDIIYGLFSIHWGKNSKKYVKFKTFSKLSGWVSTVCFGFLNSDFSCCKLHKIEVREAGNFERGQINSNHVWKSKVLRISILDAKPVELWESVIPLKFFLSLLVWFHKWNWKNLYS